MTPLDAGAVERLRRALDAPDLENERYRIVEPLGAGGMGAVYLGEDRLLERPVAIKVLRLEGVGDEGVARMMREAHTLARLEHPGIVPIHDLGRLADGRVWYAMKRVKGEHLGRLAPALPLAERLRIFLKVCETVGFAHAAGVLHRDLKPENVMVGEFGEVLVLDWGVAKLLVTPGGPEPPRTGGLPRPSVSDSVSRRSDTSAGTVLGTPDYMAPEQARGDTDVDPRTDVYGLGAVLEFLLRVEGSAPASRALVAIAARAQAHEPASRYPTVADLAADVVRWLEGERVTAHAESPFERAGRFLRKYRVAIGLVAAYMAVRALIGIFWRR